jgi:hypothetical protein
MSTYHVDDRPNKLKPIWINQQGEARPINADAATINRQQKVVAAPIPHSDFDGINPQPPKMPIEAANFPFQTPDLVNANNKIQELEALLAGAREEIADLQTITAELRSGPAPTRNYVLVTQVLAIKKDNNTASIKGMASWDAKGTEIEITVDLPIEAIKEVVARKVGQPKAKRAAKEA